MSSANHTFLRVKHFFSLSDLLDYMVLRPMSHIRPNWELSWDPDEERYSPEEDSYAEILNQLIEDISTTIPPLQYHDHEDRLAEYVVQKLNWKISKVGRRWVGADYESILEQGGFSDIDQKELLLAAAGRIRAALDRDQLEFDELEKGHRKILAAVLSAILYHRDV